MFPALFLTALLGAGGPPPPPDLAAPPPNAECLPQGLCSLVLQPGDPARKVQPSHWVTLHLKGWDKHGDCFQDTPTEGFPIQSPVKGLLKGLAIGTPLMTVGEKRRFWIPEALAFGGTWGKPRGTVVLEVEVLGSDPPPSEAPADLLKPPAEARTTSSGLTYRVLRSGPASPKTPGRTATVTVSYTGWTQDGQMFDSSLERMSTATFQLGDVIKGWREVLRLMHKGDKVRVWIPEKLAYKGESGKPAGLLVFDIELWAFWD